MSIAIITNTKKKSELWEKALKERLPNTAINAYPTIKSAESAPFILCWKPEKEQFKAFPNLKVVQSLGAGVDHIFDTNRIPEGVEVTRLIDERLTVDMWEFTLAATLNYMKDFPIYAQQQSEKIWEQHWYKTIPETTVSIMGLGKIGGFVAAQFAKLGFKTQGWSNSKKRIRKVKSFAGVSQLPKFLAKTDVLINILPLTPQTKGILNQQNLQQLKKGAYVVNVGRGGHLVEKDLPVLIDSGQLSGATLDVFEVEPLPQKHPFWIHPKITVTPHIASLTNIESAINQVVENYERMERGEELLNVVSAAKGY